MTKHLSNYKFTNMFVANRVRVISVIEAFANGPHLLACCICWVIFFDSQSKFPEDSFIPSVLTLSLGLTLSLSLILILVSHDDDDDDT
jgi:hypothetical protein